MSTANHPLFNVQGTLGALFIGLLLSCALFGILILQAYLYYTAFPEDRWRVKALVAFICLCELGHCICVCHATYYMIIIGYGNLAFLLRTPESLSIAIAFSGVIGPVVQMFFAERVRVVSGGKLIVPVFCWTISILRIALSLLASVKGYQMTTLATYQAQWQWLLTTLLSISVATDVTVSASLCYYLSKEKDKLMKRTAKIIDKLILWTIQTGLLTSIASVTIITSFLTMPDNFAWLGIFLVMARLFSNSLLASLNARTVFRTENNTNVDLGTISGHGLSNDSVINWSKGTNKGTVKPSQIVINMSTLSEVASPGESKIGGTSTKVA